MAKGRPSKSGKRTKNGRLSRAKDGLDPARVEPNDRVLLRRELFSFVRVTPELRQDGRNGEIDSEVCDALGQFHALGLLDGHGFDAKDLREVGRFWGNNLALMSRYQLRHFEALSLTTANDPEKRAWQDKFERMDDALTGNERFVLRTLIVDPLIGSNPFDREFPFWAQALIDEELIARGKRPPWAICLPGAYEREMLKAAIRGLCTLADASFPHRYQRMAA